MITSSSGDLPYMVMIELSVSVWSTCTFEGEINELYPHLVITYLALWLEGLSSHLVVASLVLWFEGCLPILDFWWLAF